MGYVSLLWYDAHDEQKMVGVKNGPRDQVA